MIEFNGYISGDAQKYFFRKSRLIASTVFIMVGLLLLPAAISFHKVLDGFNLLLIYFALLLLFLSLFFCLKQKKENKKYFQRK